MNRQAMAALGCVVALGAGAVPASAGLNAQFTGGSIFVQGSSSSPEGFNNASALGVVTATTATGSGSTSSGLAGASIDMISAITVIGGVTRVSITGDGSASQPVGYEGSANISVQTTTSTFDPDPLILSISEEAIFSITPTEGTSPVTFTAGTGHIVGNHLLPGTYEISMFFGVFMSEGQTTQSVSVQWELSMTQVPAPATLAMLGLGLVGVRRRRPRAA